MTKKYKKEECLILLQKKYKELIEQGNNRYPKRSDFGEKEKFEEESNIEELPIIKPISASYKPKPLPLYRKVLAFISLLASVGIFLYATSITDLSSIINSNGVSELG